MRVADILKIKGSAVLLASPGETLLAVAKKLHVERVGALIVSRDGNSIDGIISERDVAVSLALYGKDFVSVPVAALMQDASANCSPEDGVAAVAKIMTDKRLRHLPVVNDGTLAGIISIGDVLKHRLYEVQLESRVLRDIAIAGR